MQQRLLEIELNIKYRDYYAYNVFLIFFFTNNIARINVPLLQQIFRLYILLQKSMHNNKIRICWAYITKLELVSIMFSDTIHVVTHKVFFLVRKWLN